MKHLRDQLAVRLRALMDDTPALDTQVKVSKRAQVSQSTVQRILSRDVAATVDVIEDLGIAFNLKPSSLILLQQGEAEMLKAWLALNTQDRGEVQRLAIDLAFKHRSTAPKLDFELRKSVPAPAQVANMRASSRAPRRNEVDKQCLPPVTSSKTPKAASSSLSPVPKPRTRSG